MIYDIRKHYSSLFRYLKGTISQGLIVQNYCKAITSQSLVDFSSVAELSSVQTDINNVLSEAKVHAQYYTDEIHSKILFLISAMENFMIKINKAPEVLPEGKTPEDWKEILHILRTEALDNKVEVTNLITKMESLVKQFGDDSVNLSVLVINVSNILDDDKGELEKIKDELAGIDKEIAGLGVTVAFEALGILGGAFIVVIGAVSGFITTGTMPELVITGAVMIATGVGTLTASSISLSQCLERKRNLLIQERSLSNESEALAGIDNTLQSLSIQAKNACDALYQMKQVWTDMHSSFDNLIADLRAGIISVEEVRSTFVQLAKEEAAVIMQYIKVMKEQLSGISVKELDKNEKITDYIKTVIKNNVA